ncbi:hypothetical protein CONCODRAFT_80911 [Conidiobolus coronatus NRRL 28638]|uniref:Uncharacterized protein n=1 Tax=Conidiobolus coronatus (strain ATCC 28846 / CBS 209.66 / NRRL 28638) TaxID=796925 RepID=A0A137NPZ9_CONC2|nr:hypothetical protein CONCODRAFT_80911 [Conidiobolus coronatus NRRL 28638]|eukprot:KXN64818.1 hypothetical protein CONCODRAFT_80911 [Conidiobolus coronatus NRRL 28638]
MTSAEASPSNKGFFSRYPRWTYWFGALLIVELIIILSVVYGYVLPNKQKLKNSISECGLHYAREIGYCGSNHKSAINWCVKGCDEKDIQCVKNCYTKNEDFSTRCTSDNLNYYDGCLRNSVYYWS